jgi:signal transduction histidine kinase
MTPSPPTPARYGRWTLVRSLASGAFGTVWIAEDTAGVTVVIKQLDAPPGDELRALRRIGHPGVVTALGGGSHPTPHLVMERVNGHVLDGPLPADLVLQLAGQVADALAAVHAAGVIHGDVKPDNVVVEQATSRPVLVDFGLVGGGGGTARFAAPECLSGGAASAASDVFSLGRTVLSWLEGPASLTDQGAQATVADDGLCRWINRMLAADASARPSAGDVADGLVALGAVLAPLDPDWVRRRCASVHVVRPVDDALTAWLAAPTGLVLSGPSGSGRTHSLHRIADELQAAGRPFVWLQPDVRPWQSVADALGHAVPDGPSPADRAWLAAQALVDAQGKALVALVDDADGLDHGTAATVGALRGMGIAVLSVGPGGSTALERFDADAVGAWLDQALGGGARTALAEPLWDDTGGDISTACDALIALLDLDAVVRRDRRWVVDPIALAQWKKRPAAEDALPQRLATALVTVALAGPVNLDADVALDLTHLGRIRRSTDGWTCATRRVATAALARQDAVQAGAKAALGMLLDRGATPDRLAWAAALAGNEGAAKTHGIVGLQAASEADPLDAIALGLALEPVLDSDEARVWRMRALIAVGRASEAVALSRGHSVDMDVVTGRAVAKVGGHAAARTHLTAAHARHPNASEVQEALAEAAFRDDDMDAAIVWATPLLDEGPESRRLHARGLLAQAIHARDGAEQALQWLGCPPDLGANTKARGVFEGVCGRILWHAGRLSEAGQALERAASAPLSLMERARLNNNAGLAAYLGGNLGHALACWADALVLFERLGDETEQVRVLVNVCQGGRETGRLDRAQAAGERAVALAQSLGLPAFEAVAAGNLGDLALARGDRESAKVWWDHAEPHIDDDEGKAELARRRAELALEANEADTEARIKHAITLADAAHATVEACQARALMAMLRAQQGRPRAVRQAIDRACAPLVQAGAAGVLARVRLFAARAYLELEQFDKAREEAAHVIAYADEVGHVQLRNGADTVYAALKAIQGALSPTAHGKLARLAQVLAREHEPDQVLNRVVTAALSLLQCERAFVVLVREGEPVIAASACADRAISGAPSMSVVRRCIALRREILATDIDERGDLREAKSVVALNITAALCAPLIDEGRVLGVIYADARARPDLSFIDATDLLCAIASQATSALQTARLLADRQAQLHRAAELAHDIRSPLSAVLMLLQDLQDEGAAEPWVLEELPAALRALERVGSLAQQVLDGADKKWTVISVRDLLSDATVQLGRTARRQGLHLTLIADVDVSLRCNAGELIRAVNNVLANAVKYAPSGSEITTSLHIGERIRICVRDRGDGIPEQALDTVFNHGAQAEGSLPGHGLGLAIAHRVTGDLGGELSARNHPDGGAEVTLTLPVPTE